MEYYLSVGVSKGYSRFVGEAKEQYLRLETLGECTCVYSDQSEMHLRILRRIGNASRPLRPLGNASLASPTE